MADPDDGPDPVEAREAEDYLRRSSITFLECAIALAVVNMGVLETRRVLIQEAEMLIDLG